MTFREKLAAAIDACTNVRPLTQQEWRWALHEIANGKTTGRTQRAIRCLAAADAAMQELARE